MQTTLIGTDPGADAAVQAICSSGLAERSTDLPEHVEDTHLVVLSVERSTIGAQAAPLIRRGFHVFLAGDSAPGLRDASALLRLAEEAGVEVGMSASLRHLPSIRSILDGTRSVVCQVTMHLRDADRGRILQVVTDAADLAIAVTGSGVVQRVDAEVVRDAARHPLGLAASVRFQSGALWQLFLTIGPGEASGIVTTLGAADDPGMQSARFNPFRNEASVADAQMRGLQTFAEAVSAGRPPPVSLADSVLAMRLAERIHAAVR